jgi:hypothetical protein
MNIQSFDSDFSSRCVSISLKRPDYESSWKAKLNSFIEEKRLEIMSTLLGYLAQKSKSFRSTSRWGSWEAEVLAKVPEIDFEKVTALLQERRQNNDKEQDELELIIDELRNTLLGHGHNLETEKIFIKNKTMAQIVREATEMKSGKGYLLDYAKHLVDKGTAEELSTHRHRDWGLGFIWNGTQSGSATMILFGAKKKLH